MTEMQTYLWATVQLPKDYDYLAPDGSEIRLLPEVGGGGLAHCRLPVGGVSSAVCHQTVDEIWYFISGTGELWRQRGKQKEVRQVEQGTCLTITFGTSFQFRNIGDEPLCLIITTIPRWPGPQEAVEVDGYWK